jgi:hypothetical protein
MKLALHIYLLWEQLIRLSSNWYSVEKMESTSAQVEQIL